MLVAAMLLVAFVDWLILFLDLQQAVVRLDTGLRPSSRAGICPWRWTVGWL